MMKLLIKNKTKKTTPQLLLHFQFQLSI